MSYLTIFTAPKPFTDPHIATIQRNAIQSWIQLGAEVNVLLVGEEEGLAETAKEFGVKHLPEVARNTSGTPLVSSIFDLAREASHSPFLAYVNADILLMPDVLDATRQVSAALQSNNQGGPGISGRQFLIIGQRWDLDVKQPLDFTPGWDRRLHADIQARGQLHPPAGSDYFIFPHDTFTDIPPFAIGRAGWDNWMIFHALQQNWPVIDATPSLMIVHQNHDYSHLPGGKPHYDLQESQHNMSLAGGAAHMYMVLDADKQLIDGNVGPPRPSLVRSLRALERNMMPKDGVMRGTRGALARRVRRLRRRVGRRATRQGSPH